MQRPRDDTSESRESAPGSEARIRENTAVQRLLENLVLAAAILFLMSWVIWSLGWPEARYAMAAWSAMILGIAAHGVWTVRTCLRVGGIYRFLAVLPPLAVLAQVLLFVQMLRLLQLAAEIRDELRPYL